MQLHADIPTDAVALALREARLQDALDLLQNKIRADASDPRLRLSLFQLLCVLGQWDRARTQLQVLDSFGGEHQAFARAMGQGLLADALRREVFTGGTTPLVLGEPPAWIARLIQALRAGGAEAASLRAEAFEAAPATPARVNGEEVPWLADADSRLGPVLEGYMEGKYYWIPMERVQRVSFEAPTDLRHLVWMPAQVTWRTGGQSAILLPVRYPGSEASTDNRVRLARRTEWTEIGENAFAGLGQRMLTAGEQDFPFLEVRLIEFATA